MSQSPQSAERFNNVPPRNSALPGASPAASNVVPAPGTAGPVHPRDAPSRNTQALPPLTTLMNEAETIRESRISASPTPWRSIGVRNILNPASEAQTRQVQPAVPPSPQTSGGAGQSISHPLPQNSPHIRKRGEPHSPMAEPQLQHGGRAGRRILTPRSPSRAASLGSHRSPSMGAGMINRVPLPSGEGRGYIAEPGDNRDAAVPPLPLLPVAARNALPGYQPRDISSSTQHPSNSTSDTSFPSGGTTTPQQENRQEAPRSSFPVHDAGSSGYHPNHSQLPQIQQSSQWGAATESQGNYASSASGPVRAGLPYGQTEYQLTFETQQGPVVVPVNVDYQQASRLADEKRKRNAGASARFRARRKEKEREANQTITGLQQQLQDVLDEREFYLRERNFFRDLLARTSQAPLPNRPHSPPGRHSHPVGSSASEASPNPNSEYGRPEQEAVVMQRRRTGEYQPGPTNQSPSTPYDPRYHPPGPAMTLSTSSAAPSAYTEPRPGPSAPPQMTRPPPFDPLRRNVIDRDWTSGR